MADSYFFHEGLLDPSLQFPMEQFEMDDPTIRQNKRKKKQPRQRKKKITPTYVSDEEDEGEYSDASSEGEFYDSSSSSGSEESESEDEEVETPQTMDLMSGAIPEGVSEYEMTRLKKIQENMQMLQNLGIKHLAESTFPDADIKEKKKKKHKHDDDLENAIDYSNLEKRESKRLRGIQPEPVEELIEKFKKEKELEKANRPQKPLDIEEAELGSYSSSLWYGRPRKWFATNAKNRVLPDEIYVPLTLGSIGTTIESVGALKTGPDERFYWSNRGCLHRHPYPIGWTATKEYFGKMWTMKIKEGPKGKGPIFEVSDGQGHTYTGRTPTQPWTHVCVNSTSKGTRVSGPLFFGFSGRFHIGRIDWIDPISMKLIQKLQRSQNGQPAADASSSTPTATTDNNNDNNATSTNSNSNSNNENNGNNGNSQAAENQSPPPVKKPRGRKPKAEGESSSQKVVRKTPPPTRTTRSKSNANINNNTTMQVEASKEPQAQPVDMDAVSTSADVPKPEAEVPKPALVAEEAKAVDSTPVEKSPEPQIASPQKPAPSESSTQPSPKGKKREHQDSEKPVTPQKKAKTNSKKSPVASPSKGFGDLRNHFQKLHTVNNEAK